MLVAPLLHHSITPIPCLEILSCAPLLTDLFVEHGVPEHLRSANGPEFTAKEVGDWLGGIGVMTLALGKKSVSRVGGFEVAPEA